MFGTSQYRIGLKTEQKNRRGRYIKETASYAFQLRLIFRWPQPWPSIRKYFFHAHILVERKYSQLPQDKQKDLFVALENEYNLLECLFVVI